MFKNVKILTWLVIILLVTNLTTVVTVLYEKNNYRQRTPAANSEEAPLEQRSNFFHEQLGLSTEQMDSFRELNRNFNRKSAEISNELQILRENIIEELTKANSDTTQLNELSAQIGEKHKELKMATNDFYIELKQLSDSTQQERLAIVFRSLLQGDENINAPRMQRRRLNRQ